MILTRILKNHGLKLLLLAIVFGSIGYYIFVDPKYVGYAPDQPIPFSHKIHAGELKMQCQYCHAGVEKAKAATVPDVNTCMRCHTYVASDSKDIQYLRQAYKQGVPVRWQKVHDLPDHVHFSHKPHIARGFQCAQCHGAVETMDKVEVVAPFNMGWCVNCHRDYTTQFKDPNGPKGPGKNVSVHLAECSMCHY